MQYHLVINDYIGEWYFSKKAIARAIRENGKTHMDVKISSLGGDLNHALDIRQQFIDHGDITAYLTGFVASAATVIAMGAKRVVMSKYAMFLVHKCSNFLDVWGQYNADQMEQLIQQLTENKQDNDKIDVVLANLYAAKCGKNVGDILDTLKRGAWLTAQEALDMGFVDELMEDDLEDTSKVNFSSDMLAKFCAIGLPVEGLRIPQNEAQEDEVKPLSQSSQMPKVYNFSGAAGVLNLDTVTPDNDGYVAVTAEQFEQLSARIDSLTQERDNLTSEAATHTSRIAELEAQVENLKKLPADDTDDVVDDAVESVSSQDLYNSIQEFLY